MDPFFNLCAETIDEIVTTLWDRSGDPDESVKLTAISLMSFAAIVCADLAKVVVDALLKQSSSAQAAVGIAIIVKLTQTAKIYRYKTGQIRAALIPMRRLNQVWPI